MDAPVWTERDEQLSKTGNRIAEWAASKSDPTVGEAVKALNLTWQEVVEAVARHYWSYLSPQNENGVHSILDYTIGLEGE